MRQTVHATALVANQRGILILGASGSGKTELALDLIDQCRMRGVPAILVGDDQLFLDMDSGGVTARPAPQLEGLVEVRGSDIHRIDWQPSARIHLAVRLVAPEDALRMPEAEPVEVLPGTILPCLVLPQRSFSAVRALLVRLGIYAGVGDTIS